MNTEAEPLVRTIKDKCRICYTCVRECPAKAIKISDGQADVIHERCIGCGNCVQVCSQNAKVVHDSIEPVKSILASKQKKAAIIAPSFPAEFSDLEYKQLVGAIRKLGFDFVNEVGFGADLVAREMRKLFTETDDKYISTACPAIFGYVKRYRPELVEYLAPVVSPMVATARALRELYNQDMQIVFIGPCIAKKGEAYTDEIEDEINEVLTFKELREMFEQMDWSPQDCDESQFDPPFGNTGNIFPIKRGMLETANLPENLMSRDIVSANGRENFKEALDEFGEGDMNARLLELLCCEGCIMGAGMTSDDPMYRKRTYVSKYAEQHCREIDQGEWREYMGELRELDLTREFSTDDQRVSIPSRDKIEEILKEMGKEKPEDELNCGACGYQTCVDHAIAIHKGLAEPEMCLPFAIEKLNRTIEDLRISDEKLDNTRKALVQAEKMASMGQLAAGIAHELNNPLGTVIMFSNLLKEEIEEDEQEIEDLDMIVQEAKRCKSIVSGLLDFARKNKVDQEKVNVPEMLDNFIKTVKVDVPDNIELKVDIDDFEEDPYAYIDHDQFIQVLSNLVNNSFNAMEEKGGTLSILAEGKQDKVIFKVKDTGKGISEKHLSKIFEPFFTTKQRGKGTGLGLSVIYGIIKMHNGDINVDSNDDPAKGPTGTEFTIKIPREKRVNN
ncbi:MAG TPA: [Fe-Fe] hydrogenase large subunit C-terminal domain-containing protein [bacterium]|nr:[Fe-Fe] hydrogenase large subunit C-terminal domain-containing protein [bacterium]